MFRDPSLYEQNPFKQEYYESPHSRVPKYSQDAAGDYTREVIADQNQRTFRREPPPERKTHHFNEGGIAGLPGQWSPATIEGGEETFDLRSLGLDPGILSIEDLEDLFEQVGLDKSIIHKLINTGGLSQLVV
tara:strand:- start:136 stop:531 length:396 start_codon:yes stop_codon:yes gene_type:complete